MTLPNFGPITAPETTGPRIGDLGADYGPGTAFADSVWSEMDKARQDAMSEALMRAGIVDHSNDLMNMLNSPPMGAMDLSSALLHNNIADQTSALGNVDPSLRPRAATGLEALLYPNANNPMTASRQELIDRAKVYGIEGAEQMPEQALAQLVQQKRDAYVRPDDISMVAWLGAAGKELASGGEEGLLGVTGFGETLAGITKNIPYIGETMDRLVHSSQAAKWLAQMHTSAIQTNELTTAGLPDQYKPYGEILNKIGWGVGYTVPAIASWEAAGAMGAAKFVPAVGSAMGPLQRMAITGLARGGQAMISEWLLNGGKAQSIDQSEQGLAGAFAFGGALGLLEGAMPGIKGLFSKAQESFPTTDFAPNDAPQNVAEADWYFDDGQPQLRSAPRQLGPGPDGINPAPASPMLPGDPSPVRSMPGGPVPMKEIAPGHYEMPPAAVQAQSLSDVAPELARQRPFLQGTAVADENGPIRVYHGTKADFVQHGPIDQYSDPLALWGDGIYYTENPVIAGGDFNAQPVSPNSPLDAAGQFNWGYAAKGEGFPQVRASYLDIKNPFRLDKVVSYLDQAGYREDVDNGHDFLSQFAAANPFVDMSDMQRAWNAKVTAAHDRMLNLTYEDMHYTLQGAHYPRPEGPSLPPITIDNYKTYDPALRDAMETDPVSGSLILGRNGVNEGLKNMGYDGLTHIGGGNTGNDPHRVWIAWDPSQVHPMYAPALHAQEAEQAAINMTKQATIMESPASAALANQTDLGNHDVATAALNTNPGGISIVKDISNLGESVHKMSQSDAHFRFVERNGKVDMLVANRPISDDIAKDYETYGKFVGQEVMTNKGKLGVISKLTPAKVSVKDPYNPAVRATVHNHSSVMPRTTSAANIEAPAEYDAFRSYALQYMDEENAKAGLPQANWMGAQTSSLLPDILDRWFAMKGYNPGMRSALNEYFNIRRVGEFQAVAPDDYAHAVDLTNNANAAVEAADHEPDINELAELKHFNYVTKPGTTQGELWDQFSTLKVPVENEEAATKFLNEFNREVPDHTPLGAVPIEAAPSMNPGSDLPPSASVQDVINALDNPEGASHVWDGPAGGYYDGPPGDNAGGPSIGGGTYGEAYGPSARTSDPGGIYAGINPPRPPRGPFLDEPIQPRQITSGTDLSGAIQKLDAIDMNELRNKYTGFVGSYLRNARATFQQIQGDVETRTGMEFPIWSKYEAVEHGITRAAAEAQPWQIAASKIFAQVKTKLLTSGRFTKVFEIEDTNDRFRAAQRAGFGPKDIKAMEDLHAFTQDIRSYGLERGLRLGRVERYISHVRMRENMPGVSDPWKAALDSNAGMFDKFFAENMRYGGMTMRQMDPRWLFQHYIHAMHWALDVGPQMNEFLAMARHPDVADTMFAPIMENWAQVAQHGYNVDDDLSVKLVKGLINNTLGHVGVKLSNQQAASLINRGLTLMHWHFMGFTPKVLARDAIQPLLAGIKGDMGVLGGAYKDWFSGSQMREAMLRRGIEGGWAEELHAPIDSPSAFGVESVTSQGDPTLRPNDARVMRMLGTMGGMFRDATPVALRSVAGTRLEPVHAYAKLGQVNRIMSGEVGWRMTTKAGERVHAYGRVQAGLATPAERALVSDMLTSEGMPKYAQYPKSQFLKDSALDGFNPVVGNQAWKMVQSSDYSGAANLAGREMARETQFEYGVRNLPPAARSLSGRIGMQFGSWPTRFTGMVKTGLANGSTYRRMKFILGLSGLTAGLIQLEAKTGYNFKSWLWDKVLGFAGGPLMQSAMSKLNEVPALSDAMTPGGGNQSPDDVRKAEDLVSTATGLPMAIAQNLNPVSGLFGTYKDYSSAMDSPEPWKEALGVTLTGHSALGSHYTRAANDIRDRALPLFTPSGLPQQIHDALNEHWLQHPGSGAQQ